MNFKECEVIFTDRSIYKQKTLYKILLKISLIYKIIDMKPRAEYDNAFL